MHEIALLLAIGMLFLGASFCFLIAALKDSKHECDFERTFGRSFNADDLLCDLRNGANSLSDRKKGWGDNPEEAVEQVRCDLIDWVKYLESLERGNR